VRMKSAMGAFYVMSGLMKRGDARILNVEFSVAWMTPGAAP